MEKFFVNRPIFAIVIAVVIVLLGGLSIGSLPVELYPDITPPVVEVEASYTGADAATVNDAVATPLAESVMGVGQMLYMQTTSAGDGSMSLQVLFDIDSNPDFDEVFVQNKISAASAQLPSEVLQQGVTTQKSQTGFLLIYALHSQGGLYDDDFISNWAYINIRDELLKINGVGKVQIMGAGEYAMRVWVDPYRMASYNISVEDIASAIESEATIFPAGKLGAEPTDQPQPFTYTVTTPPSLSEAEEYENIALKVLPDGEVLRLGDVARVELGCQSYGAISNFDSDPAALVVVYQTPGSNAVEVGKSVKQTMASISDRFPEGVDSTIIIDATASIEKGIEEIFATMLFTLLLVVVVIFIFLQDWRATLVPMVAIPVSIVGAFALFPVLGFSINTISLLGLVLAIGLVVDDAIVVVEAVQLGVEQGLSPRKATLEAMRKVASPIVATTAVLLAVFVPASLMEGITGKMFQQFAMGISVSLVISAFNALTLSPALCSLLLRKGKKRATRGFFGAFNRLYDRGVDGYMRRSGVVVRQSARTIILVVIMGAATLLLFRELPNGFLTTEDQGYLMVSVELPDAASTHRTEEAIEKAVGIIRSTEGVQYEASVAGFDIISGVAATNSGVIFVTLEPYDKRTLSADEIAGLLNERLAAGVIEGEFYAFEPPSIPGLGITSGLTMMLQNRGSGDIRYLAGQTDKFMATLREQPEIAAVSTQFDSEVPQRRVVIDEQKALQQGVSLDGLRELLSTMLGGKYVGNFNRFGKLYQTYIQADSRWRLSESALDGYYIANGRGESVPISSFVALKDTVGVEYVTQFNLYESIAVNATPSAGTSSDEAMMAVERVADSLPDDVGLSWSGVSYQESTASGGGITYLLAIVFVFLALAALYNSWSLPISVLLGVPLALFGSLLMVWLAHLVNPIYIDNIFMKVSLVMLIGLAAKSAILVVEYADGKFNKEGLSLGEAALEAARLRLRPILMTAVAFMVGILPLIFASGAYSVARNIMGMALLGGMLVATALGIFVYPALYYFVGRVAHFERKRERKLQKRKEYEKENTI